MSPEPNPIEVSGQINAAAAAAAFVVAVHVFLVRIRVRGWEDASIREDAFCVFSKVVLHGALTSMKQTMKAHAMRKVDAVLKAGLVGAPSATHASPALVPLS